jgi:hypothetical protein
MFDIEMNTDTPACCTSSNACQRVIGDIRDGRAI